MGNSIIDTFTSSLSSPYRDFCEEYVRLAELIIQFEQDKIELLEKAEKDELSMLYMGQKTRYSFLGEKGIKKHFRLRKSQIIEESIAHNSGVKQVYDILNRYLLNHSVEKNKLGLIFKNGSSLTALELLTNYEAIVDELANLKARDDVYKKK